MDIVLEPVGERTALVAEEGTMYYANRELAEDERELELEAKVQ